MNDGDSSGKAIDRHHATANLTKRHPVGIDGSLPPMALSSNSPAFGSINLGSRHFAMTRSSPIMASLSSTNRFPGVGVNDGLCAGRHANLAQARPLCGLRRWPNWSDCTLCSVIDLVGRSCFSCLSQILTVVKTRGR